MTERRYTSLQNCHPCSVLPPFHMAYAFLFLSLQAKCLPLGTIKRVMLQWASESHLFIETRVNQEIVDGRGPWIFQTGIDFLRIDFLE